MTQRMQDLAAEIVRLQGELDREIEQRRKTLGWSLHEGLIAFEHGVVFEQRKLRQTMSGFLSRTSIWVALTWPVIYSLIIPFVILDAWVSAYQAICFPIYRIAPVRRGDYIQFDREHLAYLNPVEALNCAFCSYVNGLVGYVREVGARTEQYWCPIKHALKIPDPHQRYYQFVEFGDAEGYRARLDQFRQALRAEAEAANP